MRGRLALRRRRRVQQLAVGGEQRQRLIAAGKQALRLVLERKTRPAASVATTRMAGVRSASEIREQVHISAPPMRPPKPRSRSSRGAAPCGSVPASRAICSAAEPLGSMVCPVSAVDEGALKIAAAAGLPQRMRVASALHSQTGMSPSGIGRQARIAQKAKERPLLTHSRPAPEADFTGLSNLFETVIVRATCNVHAGQGLRRGRMALTLTAGRACRRASEIV